MMLREITYGIEIGLDRITLDPFDARSYHYDIGNVDIAYSERAVEISVPGDVAQREFELHGMTAGAAYEVMATGPGAKAQQFRADAHGVLRFVARIGDGVTVRARRLG
jgi:hypothetical protein